MVSKSRISVKFGQVGSNLLSVCVWVGGFFFFLIDGWVGVMVCESI